MATFTKAVKSKAKARIGIIGPSGSGKTYTALRLAAGLGEKIAVIDTEHGSASKYADEFTFDVLEPETFNPQQYIDAIQAAAGYDVLVIDSLSHAWIGKDGALEMVDKIAKRTQSGNTFTAWREVTPLHNKLIEAILSSPCHVIVTMRSKTEYVVETNERGKQVPRKVGTAPIQRDGMEYEFDIVGDMNLDHEFIITKTRCRALDSVVVAKPGAELAATVRAWLSDGVEAPTKPTPQPAATPQTAQTPAEAPKKPRNWSSFWPLMKKAFGDDNAARAVMKEQFGKDKAETLTDDEYDKMVILAKERTAA